MITVFATPFAFMSSRSISGVASRSGTRAPAANGNRSSCFHTCTCGSRIRYAGGAAAASAIPSALRRVISNINGLQCSNYVSAAALVAGPRTVAGDVQVDAQPSLESHPAEDPVAGREIDLAVAQVEDAVAEVLLRSGAPGVLVVRQHDAALVLVQHGC